MPQPGISLIVGLGNPGPEYEQTRHNVGFWLVDRLAERAGETFRLEGKLNGFLCRARIAGRDLRLLKPTTYMNHSGRSVGAVARYFDIPPEAILVAHDELDLGVGAIRLKQGGGHAGHNGLRDIIAVFGNPNFWRLRIGIGHPGRKELVLGHVLGRASKGDEAALEDALIGVEAALPDILDGEYQKAMSRLHVGR